MPLRLYNKIQHYAWGGYDYLPNLLGINNTEHKPFAELWMGTHNRGESEVEINGKRLLLSQYIAEAPVERMGKKTATQFNNQFPYLFKVLDVNEMLSIQAHPTKTAAMAGFQKENELGIPLTAAHRNYKDDNHKPEVMVALTEFWLLHGFRSVESIEKVLNVVPEFAFLKPSFATKSIFELYKTIMEMSVEAVNFALLPLKNRLENTPFIPKSNPDYWAKLGFEQHSANGNLDKGIFSIYLYNLVKIEAGNGIYQAANVPHSYLEGVNIELMANSDNVFRGGLTVKHVDVEELLKHLHFESITPNILKGEEASAFEVVFKTEAQDFEVSRIRLEAGNVYTKEKTTSPETLIVIEGEATINDEVYKKGESCFVTAGSRYQISTTTKTLLYKANVPV